MVSGWGVAPLTRSVFAQRRFSFDMVHWRQKRLGGKARHGLAGPTREQPTSSKKVAWSSAKEMGGQRWLIGGLCHGLGINHTGRHQGRSSGWRAR
jgi:hypothetical protein